jgi:light-harvesting complex I chlorophyll a/b binding protein 1
MQNVAVVALALLESASAFQAPALRASSKAVQATMFSEGDLGVLPPLGVYDPLGLIETRNMARYEVMEIKHGRAAMLGFLHVILIEAGFRFPVDDCAAAPAGLLASLESCPTSAWLQIMVTTCMMETGYFLFDAQGADKEAGDIGGEAWVRYDDPSTKAFKLNAERQNGRAAMLGITGCLLHELLGADALYPTGGLAGGAPPTIF